MHTRRAPLTSAEAQRPSHQSAPARRLGNCTYGGRAYAGKTPHRTRARIRATEATSQGRPYARQGEDRQPPAPPRRWQPLRLRQWQWRRQRTTAMAMAMAMAMARRHRRRGGAEECRPRGRNVGRVGSGWGRGVGSIGSVEGVGGVGSGGHVRWERWASASVATERGGTARGLWRWRRGRP